MFDNLRVCIDQVSYDPENSYSYINGWAIDPITKNPVTIEGDIPAMINTVYRSDVNETYGVTRDTEYGFIICFPGSIYEIQPNFVFRSGDMVENYGFKEFDKKKDKRSFKFLYSLLVEQGIPKLPNPFQSRRARKELERTNRETIEQTEPDDPFKDWMENVEPTVWTKTQITELPVSYILTVKNPEKDWEKSLQTIEEQLIAPERIIIATTEDLDFGDREVVRAETIEEAINQAIEKVDTEYFTLLDNGDQLDEHFSTEVAEALVDRPDFVYADSDKINNWNERYDLHFKPDFDEIKLRSHNYILQPIIVKTDLAKDLGGIREDKGILQQYDFILRATEAADKIVHIPKILYHWNAVIKKLASDSRLLEEYKKGTEILEERFSSEESPENFIFSEIDYIYDLQSGAEEKPSVTLIVGVQDGFDDRVAIETIETILSSIDYQNLEILAVNVDIDTDDERVRKITDTESRSILELYNKAAKETDTEAIAFLKPGFEAIEYFWLDEMMNFLNIDEVGIVGPKAFTNLYQVYEAGLEIRDGKRERLGDNAYCSSYGHDYALRAPREVFAASKNCLLIERDLFEKLGGFDTSLNPFEADIDLSIRARDLGKKTVIANNTPVTYTSFSLSEDQPLDGLRERYPEAKLVNQFINERFLGDTKNYESRGI